MSLIDKVIKNFASIRLRKSTVVVPELEIKKATASVKLVPSIAEVVSRVQKLQNAEKKSKTTAPKTQIDENTIKAIKENLDAPLSGYGISKASYGISPQSAYTDYRLFSHLGQFRARRIYQMGQGDFVPSSMDKQSFSLIDTQVMETGARHVRYFSRGSEISTTSMVPIAGMTPEEWNSFKLFMQLEPVMYRFKTTTS